MSINENLQKIKYQINEAEKKSGRQENCVKLMAVSKFHPVDEILQAVNAGQFLFGENRVQEAAEKFPEIFTKFPGIELHMIGQLQSNKVKKAVQIASCIQSVDTIKLLNEINNQCEKLNKNINILFEVHTGEDSKSGFSDETELFKAVELCASGQLKNVHPKGFMTMAPFTNDEKLIRESFIKLRKLKESLQNQYRNLDLSELSMGMSGDFKLAIEEGSTMVRVGTAIFGERNYSSK